MLTVINDTHIGVARKAGTTPESALALRKYILAEFSKLLPADGDLLINGDLFDSFSVPLADVLETYYLLADWLKIPSRHLVVSRGNHDVSKDSSNLSSFDLIGRLLTKLYPKQVQFITEPTMTKYGYVIPHLVNQDRFDEALKNVPACETLYLHCNYDNGFATQSDHSLNITKEQVERLNLKDVVIGHEHHPRFEELVSIPGTQIPTSIADWLGNCEMRYKLEDGIPKSVMCRYDEKQFLEVDWTNLGEVLTKPRQLACRFIRVTGHATPEQAVEMTSAIANFRSKSSAFVVANAVSVGEDEQVGEIGIQTLEDIQKFNVIELLKEFLTVEEYEKVSALCNT